jgi:hypothetical protein
MAGGRVRADQIDRVRAIVGLLATSVGAGDIEPGADFRAQLEVTVGHIVAIVDDPDPA